MTEGRASKVEAVERYAKLVQNLTIIFGIVSGVVSLFATQYDRRVSRTIEMTRLYTDKVRGDYLSLATKWDKYTASIPNFFQLQPPDMKAKVVTFFEGADVHGPLLNYLDFYDTLMVCIDNRACDRNSAIDYFSRTAGFAYDFAYYYIAETRTRDRDPAFGRALERFRDLKHEGFVSRYI